MTNVLKDKDLKFSEKYELLKERERKKSIIERQEILGDEPMWG